MAGSGSWWERLDGPLLGRYRIDRVLGEGGMARVFAATDVKTNRPVAIKTPKIESFPPDRVEELLKRFHREFQSQIQEPIRGVVPVYDALDVTDANGVVRPILVMQHLTGGSLADRLGGQVGARERTQTPAEVLAWLDDIAGAVDTLHRRRFVHRDIKPDNILFDRDGNPFLADFGVVGLLDAATGMGSTMGGSTVGLSPGSPGYQSPESIKADPLTRSTPAGDQFSLGITVYEALTGRLPMAAGSIAEWYGALANWNPTSVLAHCPDLPPAAAAAVMKAISAQPNERFVTCSQFAEALEAAVRIPVREPTPPGDPTGEDVAADQGTPPGSASTTRRVLYFAIPAVFGLALVLAWDGLRPDVEYAQADATPTRPGIATDQPSAAGNANHCTVANFVPGRDDDCKGLVATVNFDWGKPATLTPDAVLILEDVAGLLQRYPALRIELGAHGEPSEAAGAAEVRTRTVRDFLVARGIGASRLTALRYDTSETDGAEHRRVDLIVTAHRWFTRSEAGSATDVPADSASDEVAELVDDFLDTSDICNVANYVPNRDDGCGGRIATVYFDNDKSELTPETIVVLDGVVGLLQSHPTLQVEIAGHTSSVESEEGASAAYAQASSQRRAASVLDYLSSRGIAASRLSTAGYGATRPQVPDVDADGTKRREPLNRRVEVIVK